MYLRTNRGLGSTADLPQGILGTGPVDCTGYGTWLITPECWKYSPSAWAQIVAFGQPSSSVIVPPPAVSAGTSTVPAPYACSSGAMATAATNCPEYSAAVDAALSAGQDLTGQSLLNWYGQQVPVAASPSVFSSIPTWAWIGLAGVAAFAFASAGGGSAQRYGR